MIRSKMMSETDTSTIGAITPHKTAQEWLSESEPGRVIYFTPYPREELITQAEFQERRSKYLTDTD